MANNKQRVIVVGATGFLGDALAKALLKRGRMVIGIGRRERGFLCDDVIGDKNFVYLRGDSISKAKRYIRPGNIDAVFHLASQQPKSDNISYKDFHKGNVETTLEVADIAIKHRVKAVIYASTTAVFGKPGNGRTVSEESQPNPSNCYSLTKYIAEQTLKIMLAGTGIKVIVIRYPSLFGKNHLGGLVYTLYREAKTGKFINILGGGSCRRNILYVDDAARGIVLATEKYNKSGPVNLGSGQEISIKDLVNLIVPLTGFKGKVIWDKSKPDGQPKRRLDVQKAKKEFGFTAKMNFEEGLKKTILWYKNHVSLPVNIN